MQAAILVIGDEILAGRTQDTNSAYIAARLARLGVPVAEIRTVGDDPTAIQLAAWDLAERRRADLVITSGGLGPTHDDRTVAAVATLHGARLEHHDETWKRMQQRAAAHKKGKRGDADPGPGAAKVALVPQGAHVLPNPAGAAPGLLLERPLRMREGTAWTIVLPGVPQELRAIWTAHAEAWLAQQVKDDPTPDLTLRYECHGQESVIAPALVAVEHEHPEVRVGSYPGWATTRIVLTITGPADAASKAAKSLDRHLQSIGMAVTLLPEQADP